MLRWLTAGESHGRALVAICEGVPTGVEITTADIARALARRRAGYGRGARMKFEQDEVEITGGVRHGVTLGSPIAIRIANTEWPKWESVMSTDPVGDEVLAAQARNAPLTRPRPGHADLAGMQKYGHDDARAVLERASARDRGPGRIGRDRAPLAAPGGRRRDPESRRRARRGCRARGLRSRAERRRPDRRRPGPVLG